MFLTIGRSPENTVVIKDDKVSRKHCKIQKLPENEFLIEDLDSSGGTFVNNRRIKQTLLKQGDNLKLASFEVDAGLLLSVFSLQVIPVGMPYENLLKQQDELAKQQRTMEEFHKLKDVYDNYIKQKLKIIKGNTLKSTGLRAGLALIPFVGNALGILSGNVTGNIQERLLELDEQFKKDYICPMCFKFLGFEPFENMLKRGYCLYNKCKWVQGV